MKKIIVLAMLITSFIATQCSEVELEAAAPVVPAGFQTATLDCGDKPTQKDSLKDLVVEKDQNPAQEPNSLGAVVLVGGLGGAIFMAGCQIS